MSDRERIHFEGAVYHVNLHGVNDQDVFLDDEDRVRFLSILERVRFQTASELLAYCLLGNHFHLVVRVLKATLSTFMLRLAGTYAKGFNERHGRKGHLFGERHNARLCLDEGHLLNAIRYVNHNAVKHGFVEQAKDWPWSSFHAYESGRADPFVRISGLPIGAPGVTAAPDPGFEPWTPVELTLPESSCLLRRPSGTTEDLAALLDAVAGEDELTLEALVGGGKCAQIVKARKKAVGRALAAGFRSTDIARVLGVSKSAISHYCAKPARNSTD